MQRVLVSRIATWSKSLTRIPYISPHIVHAALSPVTFRSVCTSPPVMSYSIIEKGCPNTKEYRLFFSGPGGLVSPFHDIPLYANAEEKIFNMVVEIPRWTNSKMEISKEEKLNPIKQDIKKGELRMVKNIFPHHGYIWNYGALPQTWEDPEHMDDQTKTKGDCDPLDVCEIGYKVQKRGAVIQVKVLGVMCLVDEGETDWKLIVIDVTDPMAEKLNDIGDVEKLMPGLLKATNEWFRLYKIPDGKPENKFAFNGEAQDKEFAMKVIDETNGQWKKLLGQEQETSKHGMACENTSVGGSPDIISQDEAKEIVNNFPELGPPELPIKDSVDMWHFVKL